MITRRRFLRKPERAALLSQQTRNVRIQPLMATLIQIKEARCRISPSTTLQIDDFTVMTGEHWCVFGPNGVGKTSLARLLAGQMRESGFYVKYGLNNEDGVDFDPKLDIHLVSFEEQQRLWQRDDRVDISEYSESAQDQGTSVETLIRSSRHPQQQDESVFTELMNELALQPLRKQGIRFLSSGQMRKAMLARALYAHRGETPQLILLDDPLESIDRESRQPIEACISRFLTGRNASLQFSRRQQDIPAHATHMAVMMDMQIAAQGPRPEVEKSAAYRSVLARAPAKLKTLPTASRPAEAATVGTEPLIELCDVSASYGEKRILSNINWRMLPRHHVLIEGPNGCGKSTLLSLIDGENHKGYGQELYLFGRRKGSGEAVWDIKARFGLVSNELHNKYVKGWRILEVVVSGFFDSVGLYDNSGSTETTAAMAWLKAFGIADLQRHYYHELSFGLQRLVLLARAMVKEPAILVLDEPCVGLDDYHRQLILQTLDLIAALTATRLIYVSHVVGEQPQCINQRLGFVPSAAGGYTLIESNGAANTTQPRI